MGTILWLLVGFALLVASMFVNIFVFGLAILAIVGLVLANIITIHPYILLLGIVVVWFTLYMWRWTR